MSIKKDVTVQDSPKVTFLRHCEECSDEAILYVGVTSNLIKRVYQHREKLVKGFTAKYHTDKLVYYELFEDINEAIKREKKLRLIESTNPGFEDLYQSFIQ